MNLVISLLNQLLSGASYLIEKGIIHCDLKLDNMLIDKKDKQGFQIVISDFGSACEVDSEIGVRGTAPYFAPEMARIYSRSGVSNKVESDDNKEVMSNKRSRIKATYALDAFTIGAIIYQLLSAYQFKTLDFLNDIVDPNKPSEIDYSRIRSVRGDVTQPINISHLRQSVLRNDDSRKIRDLLSIMESFLIKRIDKRMDVNEAVKKFRLIK